MININAILFIHFYFCKNVVSATIQGQSFPSKKLLKGKDFPASKPEEVQTLLANSLHNNKSTISMEKDMSIVLKMHI